MWISHIPLKTTIDLSDQSESDSGLYYEDLVERVQEEVDIFSAQRIESELGQLLESLETKSHLENYNIICLFNVEFSYMKQLFKKLPMDQMCMIKNKWSEVSFTLLRLLNEITEFSYTRVLQLLRRHSALLDSSSSEYQYRDEIVNILLASIFYDVEDALWTKTKQQRNFIKQENERERLGDKHDGILYMNVRGVKVGVGFIEVADNAFNTITSDKNDDLEKLLKDSGLNLLHVGDIVKIVKKFKIRMIKYCHKLIQEPRIATRHTISGLPTLHKKNQNE
ncbi:16991_t:CDS:2 [Entrophospora sp. SA101]|nr:16991_t:CDS:2 [Entrophospora sp. SA101]